MKKRWKFWIALVIGVVLAAQLAACGQSSVQKEEPKTEEAASVVLLKEQLLDVLGSLTPREQKVVMLRYGIEDGHPKTLEEVGKEFNVTRERIRQIEAKALKKLRHPSRSKKLKDFMDN